MFIKALLLQSILFNKYDLDVVELVCIHQLTKLILKLLGSFIFEDVLIASFYVAAADKMAAMNQL